MFQLKLGIIKPIPGIFVSSVHTDYHTFNHLVPNIS